MSGDGTARLRELQTLQQGRGLSEAEWEEAALLLAAAGRAEEAERALRNASRQRAKRARQSAPPPAPASAATSTSPTSDTDAAPARSVMRSQIAPPGCITMIIAAAVIFFFAAIFDTSVEVPHSEFMGYSFGGDRVNNLGLMQDRLIGIVVGSVLLLGGFLSFLVHKLARHQ